MPVSVTKGIGKASSRNGNMAASSRNKHPAGELIFDDSVSAGGGESQMALADFQHDFEHEFTAQESEQQKSKTPQGEGYGAWAAPAHAPAANQ